MTLANGKNELTTGLKIKRTNKQAAKVGVSQRLFTGTVRQKAQYLQANLNGSIT